MTRTFLFTAACLVLALGCTPPPSAELTEDDLAAIRHRFDELARHLSPEDNVAGSPDYTDDVQFLFVGMPMFRGRDALYEWGENDSPVALSASFSDIEIHGSGDWAWATSSYVITAEGVDGPVLGDQLLVLERQADDTWLIAAVAYVGSVLPTPGN